MAKQSDLGGELIEVSEQVDVITAKRREKERQRRAQALSLAQAGFTFEQIGERLEISPEGAQDLVQRTLARVENRAAEDLRALEASRLDRAQAAIWSKVLEGDLKAVDTFLRLSTRRAIMLGLDAPKQVTLSVSVRAEMEQALAELSALVLEGEVDGDPYP